ncbi:MAG: hypothetical protein NVS2B7_08600 [Herpetosiphon sp.]
MLLGLSYRPKGDEGCTRERKDFMTMASLSSTSTAGRIAPDTTIVSAVPRAHTTYQIDPTASRVEFSIRKRLFFIKQLTVTGSFADVAGTITLDEQDPGTVRASITIGAASIDTGNARRDTHLRTADFFDVDRHPMLTFHSRRVAAVDAAVGCYTVVGDLTVRDVTREVVLETQNARALDAGHDRLALTLTTALTRQDFGIVWQNPLMKVADDLTVTLTIAATRV